MMPSTTLLILQRALDGTEPVVIAEQLNLGRAIVHQVLDVAGYPDPDEVRAWRDVFKLGPRWSPGIEEAA